MLHIYRIICRITRMKYKDLMTSLKEAASCGEVATAGWSPRELTNILVDAAWLPAFPAEETPSNVLTDFSAGRLMQAAIALKAADLAFQTDDSAYLKSVLLLGFMYPNNC